MKYRLETLSPVHIGNGDIYSSLNICCNKDKISIYDEDIVIRKLLEKGLNYQTIIDKFDLVIDGKGYSITNFLDDENISIDEFETKYRLINKTGTIEFKKIRENTKNLNGLCIPGSSIKGAIRTAIFYKYVKEKGIEFIKDIMNFYENFVLINKNYRNVSVDDYILYLYKKKLDRNKKPNSLIDPKKDPFKYLIVRDADFDENVLGVVYKEGILNSRNTGNIIEAISQDYQSNIFEIKITNKENLFRLSHINKVNKDILEYLDEDKLKECIYEHNKDMLENEIEYYNSLKWKAFNNTEIISFLKNMKAINSKETPIIRLGKNIGLFSHSIALAVKTLDHEFYEDYFVDFLKKCNYKFRVYKNLGFPKTRKFVGNIASPKLLGFTLLKKVD